MKPTVKLLLIVTAFVLSGIEAGAQKISAAAVVDQHYAAQTSNYKLMMMALATAYGVYLLLNLRRRKQMDRFMGRL